MSGRVRVAAVIGVAILLLVVWARSAAPGDVAVASPAPSTTTAPGAAANGLATFQGDGFAFEYPASWHVYPLRMTASFFSVVAYLASEPIDTAGICQTNPNGSSCNFRGYDLHPGQVAVEIAAWGSPITDPLAFWDRPTDGRRVVVGGAPAIVSQEAVGPGRTVLTWKIARSDVLDNWIQLDADVMGPGDAVVRAQVDASIASFRLQPAPTPLDLPRAADIGNAALRGLRTEDAEGFACFPPVGQSVIFSVTALPGAPLRQPLTAKCSTSISPTDLGFWRMELVAAWGADPAQPTLRYTTEQWLRADGTLAMRSEGGDTLPFCCRG